MIFFEALNQIGIKNPGLEAYTAEIQKRQQQMRTEKDLASKRELQNELNRLRQEMNQKKIEKQKELANLQKTVQATQKIQ